MARSKSVACEFEGCDRSYSSEHSRRQHYRRFHKGEWLTSSIRRRAPSLRQLHATGEQNTGKSYQQRKLCRVRMPWRRISEGSNSRGTFAFSSDTESDHDFGAEGLINSTTIVECQLSPNLTRKTPGSNPRHDSMPGISSDDSDRDRGFVAPQMFMKCTRNDSTTSLSQSESSPRTTSAFDSGTSISRSASFTDIFSTIKTENEFAWTSNIQDSPTSNPAIELFGEGHQSFGSSDLSQSSLSPPISQSINVSHYMDQSLHSPWLSDKPSLRSQSAARPVPYDLLKSAHANFINQISCEGAGGKALSHSAPLQATMASPPFQSGSNVIPLTTQPHVLATADSLTDKMADDLISTLSAAELQLVGSLAGMSMTTMHDTQSSTISMAGRAPMLTSSLSQPLGNVNLSPTQLQQVIYNDFSFAAPSVEPSTVLKSHSFPADPSISADAGLSQTLDMFVRSLKDSSADIPSPNLVDGFEGASPAVSGSSNDTPLTPHMHAVNGLGTLDYTAGRSISLSSPFMRQDSIPSLSPCATAAGSALFHLSQSNMSTIPPGGVIVSSSSIQAGQSPFQYNTQNIPLLNSASHPVIASPEQLSPSEQSPWIHPQPLFNQSLNLYTSHLQQTQVRRATFPNTQVSSPTLPSTILKCNTKSSCSASPGMQFAASPVLAQSPQLLQNQCSRSYFLTPSNTQSSNNLILNVSGPASGEGSAQN